MSGRQHMIDEGEWRLACEESGSWGKMNREQLRRDVANVLCPLSQTMLPFQYLNVILLGSQMF